MMCEKKIASKKRTFCFFDFDKNNYLKSFLVFLLAATYWTKEKINELVIEVSVPESVKEIEKKENPGVEQLKAIWRYVYDKKVFVINRISWLFFIIVFFYNELGSFYNQHNT